ncbi:MAG: hypothetical protein ACKO3W_12355 [bacterium]
MKTMRLITPSLITTFLALSLSSVAFAQDGAPPPGGPGGGAGGQGGQGGEGGQGGQRPGGRGGQVDPAQMVERMMGMDANGDGKLSRDEMPPMLVERILERADTNKDGFVERAELEVIAKEGGALRGGGQAGPGGGRGGAAGGAPMNMEGAMKQANAALRTLRASALDSSTQKADLEAVQRLQMGLVGAKGGIASVPMSDAAKAKFGEDKAAYEREFRKTMLASIMLSFEVEKAILEGDGARAKATLEKLHDSEETGHELFQREEGGKEGGKEGSKEGAAPAGSDGGEGGERPRGRGGRANRPPATE